MEKKDFDIANFPALNDDASINTLHAEIKELDHNLAAKITLFKEGVKRVQNNCSHEWKETTARINRFNHCSKSGGSLSDGSAEVLASKSCTKCGVIENRPEGQPWDVCYFCWSPMKFNQRLPSEDRECIYYCTNEKCNHGSWHT